MICKLKQVHFSYNKLAKPQKKLSFIPGRFKSHFLDLCYSHDPRIWFFSLQRVFYLLVSQHITAPLPQAFSSELTGLNYNLNRIRGSTSSFCKTASDADEFRFSRAGSFCFSLKFHPHLVPEWHCSSSFTSFSQADQPLLIGRRAEHTFSQGPKALR